MPVVDFETYGRMLDHAQKNDFAFPAINITSMTTANAALKAFGDANSDGIIQVSTGGSEFASGLALKDAVVGAITLAEHIHRMAAHYNVHIAIHTDHCVPAKVGSFLIPLIEESERRVAAGQLPLFSSHMFDGSELALNDNLDMAVPLFERCAKIGIILEVEAGCVGGEEDGIDNTDIKAEKLYTTPEDMVEVHRRLSAVEGGRFMFAATFGNVHGVYKPGNVVLTPTILRDGQAAVVDAFGKDAYFDLVFHGGSGSSKDEIYETLGYGVVKMNVDTDCQYSFTRPVADHIMKNYDGVLRIEGEMGNKKVYDPRSYLKKAEQAMADRVTEAIDDLRSRDRSICS
ncbi:MAG: fructose-bisphosphate aldolase class II [Rhodothermales bacterium]|jgi:fructose-bisphosphate aldolase class II